MPLPNEEPVQETEEEMRAALESLSGIMPVQAAEWEGVLRYE